MSTALATLQAARSAGIEIEADGSRLRLRSAIPPSRILLGALRQNEPEIIEMLTPGEDGRSPEDWACRFDEIAGQREYEDHMPRPEAEACARQCCITEWLACHPGRSTTEAEDVFARIGMTTRNLLRPALATPDDQPNRPGQPIRRAS
ncbi:hypothetical protein [Bosea sp. NBC_00550]|uniref:hypothetical protein n=1 Tax=Bosea sp. NBC_00550 TaxID=2969621 RepID=UPI00222FA164|nr:hypothetical protein [Bosea sp. NBC_00550]UZF94383.1 hypothetical protein NWE53_09470 [Bosea sp. NBC_00550]